MFFKRKKEKKRQIYFRKVINVLSPTRKLLVNKTLLQVWQSLNQNTMTSTIAQRLDRKGISVFFAPVFYHLFGKSLTKGKDFLERRQICLGCRWISQWFTNIHLASSLESDAFKILKLWHWSVLRFSHRWMRAKHQKARDSKIFCKR